MSKTYCIFSSNYLPNIGGIERYTQNLAYSLANEGDKVIIVTSNVFHLPEKEALRENVEIVRLPCYNALHGRWPVSRKSREYRRLFDGLLASYVDYVIINTRFYVHSLEGLRYAEAKGIRPLIIDHGSAHLTLGNKYLDIFVAWGEHIMTSLAKRHDADYYAVSKAGSIWLGHFGIESMGELNNSIDAKAFRSSSSSRDFRYELNIRCTDFVVVFVGRLIPEKGIESLLDAAKILSEYEEIVFVVAGDGPLKNLVDEVGLRNLRFLHRLNSPDVAALLLASDAFCLPSRSEGFSTSLLECASCEATPIVTKVGGVDELMPSEDYGCFLREVSSAEIVENILKLYNSRDLNRRLAANLRSRVEEHFSWKVTAEKVRCACKHANECGASNE